MFSVAKIAVHRGAVESQYYIGKRLTEKDDLKYVLERDVEKRTEI